MGELPTQASLTAQIDCTGGGCFSFTRMGTGGGCCSFPPLLQLTVAVVRVVKTLAEADSASDLLVLEACGLTLADFEKTT